LAIRVVQNTENCTVVEQFQMKTQQTDKRVESNKTREEKMSRSINKISKKMIVLLQYYRVSKSDYNIGANSKCMYYGKINEN